MQIDDFCKLRPFVFHTTALTNLDRIRQMRELQCARRLIELATGGADSRVSEHRKFALSLQLGSRSVVIRDQRPLAAGAIAFEVGWDLPRLVAHLNGFVFFWPGSHSGPIKSGRDHYERYRGEGENLAVLRISTGALFELNRERPPQFSRCNSGSARCNNGQKAPRGATTFRTNEAFATTPGDVKEVVIEDWAALPPATEIAMDIAGPWGPL